MPRLGFGVVDVRDAASLHLLAMTRPEAAGERFLGTADSMTLQVRCSSKPPSCPGPLLARAEVWIQGMARVIVRVQLPAGVASFST